MKPVLNDYRDLLEVTMNDLTKLSFSIEQDDNRRLFLVFLNNADVPIELPFWEVKERATTTKIWVSYLRNKLGVQK